MKKLKIRSAYIVLVLILSTCFITGCGGGGGTGHWDGQDDIIAPTVTFTVPANDVIGVAINTAAAATFSEAMDPLTITDRTFTLKRGAVTINGTVDYTGITAVFTPAADLDANTLYTATITTNAKDLAGNALASNYIWTFTTGATADNTRPTVTFNVPANGATGIATNTAVAATFSEAMNPLTITDSTFTLKRGAVTINGTVDYTGISVVFRPAANLAVNTLYTATITTNAKDLAGNALASNYVWTFTTGATADNTRPTVTLTVPADRATNVAINSAVTATFSEAMDPLTITNQTFTLLDGATVVDGTVTYLGLAAVFRPTTDLDPNTTYTATIASTVTDLTVIGNELAGNQAPLPAASDYIWTFDTGVAADSTEPTITITNPDDLDTDVPINKKINATFSEAMNPLTMTTANIMLEETLSGDPVSGTVAYDIENYIATFFPTVNLTPDTDYTATVSDQSEDLAGNALVVPALGGFPTPNPWTFKTAAAAVPLEPLAINLRGAASFGIAAQAGLTSTGVTVVNGDVALYPLAGCTDSTGNAGASQDCLVQTYSSPTGMTVNGSIYWAGDPFDNGETANAVADDLNIAWVEGKNKTPTMPTVAGDQLASAIPYLSGVYHNATLNFQIGGVATLDAQNDVNAIFIFQVDSSFTDSGTLLQPSEIKLINGAQARNVWFVVGLDVTIGSGTTWKGNILAGRDVTVNNGSTVLGRVLGGASGAGAFVLTGAANPSVTTITVP